MIHSLEKCITDLNIAKTPYEKMDISTSLTRAVGINESKIIKNSDDLDRFMLGPKYKK